MLVYCAGKYRSKTGDWEEVAYNVQAAEELAAILLGAGYEVFCPHSMTHGWERYEYLNDDDFLRNGIELLRRCDAVILLPGWEDSDGTLAEIACADANHIPVFKTISALNKHCKEVEGDG